MNESSIPIISPFVQPINSQGEEQVKPVRIYKRRSPFVSCFRITAILADAPVRCVFLDSGCKVPVLLQTLIDPYFIGNTLRLVDSIVKTKRSHLRCRWWILGVFSLLSCQQSAVWLTF